jgi:hypothetical protein
LIVFLAITSVIGFTALQDSIIFENQFVENQSGDIKDFSSEGKTITVDVSDGVGMNLN